jgi:pteridine reductase
MTPDGREPALPFQESLAGKVVLVTGAARRVGAAIASHLHARGATVAIHYRNSVLDADQLADDLNARRAESAFLVRADLDAPASAPVLIDAVLDHAGRIDALVNNASTFFPTPLGQIDEAAWTRLVGSNFMAPLFIAQAAAPHLRKSRGAIVNITDVHAERPLKGYALYCAAKGALLTLTRALAVELGPEVRVNAVAPGPILWPDDQLLDGELRRATVDHTLLKREGSPEEIAAAVGFLIADASYVTGQVINVDGGRTAHL